jgi:hypothetical protein
VILDGSKALRKAVRATFGEAALVQRCQVHIAGRNPRLLRGERSSPGQVPMRPVVWGQAWRGNWPRRSRPDNVASVPSPEAPTKSWAATKVNAFGAVNASWTSIAGRVQDVESPVYRRRQQRPWRHGAAKRSCPRRLKRRHERKET